MRQLAIDIPHPLSADTETVITALETAELFSSKGDTQEAVRWLRRAAESAGEAGDDARALALSRTAADLREALEVKPRPVSVPRPSTAPVPRPSTAPTSTPSASPPPASVHSATPPPVPPPLPSQPVASTAPQLPLPPAGQRTAQSAPVLPTTTQRAARFSSARITPASLPSAPTSRDRYGTGRRTQSRSQRGAPRLARLRHPEPHAVRGVRDAAFGRRRASTRRRQ